MRADSSQKADNVEGEAAPHHPGGKAHITSARHDVLYSKARYVLHQRHIKRPWFNLNPFLEKTDETIDLDNFLPEESKYIQRLESLVLCETYTSDLPLDTRELALGVFFEYLNSDLWKDGCSIRVLEGQLLDQLLISLYRLEKENIAIRHTTYAFARNKRPITGCYKLADTGLYGTREETLMIEFAYFGRLNKPKSNIKSQNPLEYIREGVTEYSDDDTICIDSALPPLQEKSSGTQVKRRNRAASIHVDTLSSCSLPEPDKTEIPKWGRRGSLMSKQVNAIGFLTALNPQARRKSISIVPSALPNLGVSISPPVITIDGSFDKRRESTVTSSSDDVKGRRRRSSIITADSPTLTYRQRKPSLLHSRYLEECDDTTPSVHDLGEEGQEEGENHDEDKGLYGDEFYLRDTKLGSKGKKESTLKKLRRNKKQLQQRRDEIKEEREEIANFQPKCRLPPLPPLDLARIQESVTMHHTIKMPDEVPTFEELMDLLKEDEYFDPRYRNRVRLKSKMIAQRYYISNGMHRTSLMFNLEHLPNDVKYGGLSKRYMQQRASIVKPPPGFNRKRRGSITPGSKGNLQLPPLTESGRRTPRKSGVPSSLSISSSQRFAEEVHGVTDSEPCKEHCLKPKGSFNKPKEERLEKLKCNGSSQGKKSQAHLVPSGQDVGLKTVTEEKLENNLLNRTSSLRISQASPIIPKMELNDEASESSDTDTYESDTESETPSLFDGTKVNVRYSIERLRKKRRLKKKKPAFMEILSKYCNTHAALKAFRKGSGSREGKSVRDRVKRMGRAKKGSTKSKEKKEFVIGKLRKFSFNDAKQRKKLTLEALSRGEFSQTDLARFHDDLRKAMDEFVIRREIVVSDKQTFYRPATSVTFTKRSCFQSKHVDG